MTLLVHPQTGGQIDVPPAAVETWSRSGWAPPEDPAADGPAAKKTPAKAGTAEPAGVTDGATAA